MNFALWLTINIGQTAVDLCCVNCEMTVPSRHDWSEYIRLFFYGQISLSLFLQSTYTIIITLHKDHSIAIYSISIKQASFIFKI